MQKLLQTRRIQKKTPEQFLRRSKGRLGKVVAKGKDFGNTVATKARAAGTAAKAHVGRNKAAYIAGGLGAAGLAAGTTGIALASRKKQPQDEG